MVSEWAMANDESENQIVGRVPALVGQLTVCPIEYRPVGARDAGSRPAVQREAGGKSHHGQPNLRCPRNGKQTGRHSREGPAFISNHWPP
jgi:hypothetical protein